MQNRRVVVAAGRLLPDPAGEPARDYGSVEIQTKHNYDLRSSVYLRKPANEGIACQWMPSHVQLYFWLHRGSDAPWSGPGTPAGRWSGWEAQPEPGGELPFSYCTPDRGISAFRVCSHDVGQHHPSFTGAH